VIVNSFCNCYLLATANFCRLLAHLRHSSAQAVILLSPENDSHDLTQVSQAAMQISADFGSRAEPRDKKSAVILQAVMQSFSAVVMAA